MAIFRFFKKYYIVFLALIVIISYGQILGMYVWQDDNALFFKLANIEGPAGYLGTGPFGQGAYKYTATPYIPIFLLFGHNTVPYFILALVLYFLATLAVYKAFWEMLGRRAGRVAGFLFAAGYIASDGFIRLYNTVITSLSIILVSFLALAYYRFIKHRELRWYALALGLYILGIEMARARTHYLIGVIFLFELLFLKFKSPLKSFFSMLVRVTPFGLVFFIYFIKDADKRSGQIKTWVVDILSGEFYKTYSFFGSVANLVLPEWLSDFLVKNGSFFTFSLIVLGLCLGFIFLLRKTKGHRFLIPILISVALAWAFAASVFFENPALNLERNGFYKPFLGGMIILFGLAVGITLPRFKKEYFLFWGWLLLNLATYGAYNPLFNYVSINRYLAHSFFALVAISGILVSIFPGKKFVLWLVLLWGVGNMASAVFYQHEILKVRAAPARTFYKQLREYLPVIERGDVLYFDVAQEADSYFRDAFSVAQMPEETAIAWRYGIDRYDLKIFTDFTKLTNYINSNKVGSEKVHSFWYSRDGLTDTTPLFVNLFYEGKNLGEIKFDYKDNVLTFNNKQITGVVPAHILLGLVANPKYVPNNQRTLSPSSEFIAKALEYQRFKKDTLEKAGYLASSQWQDRTIDNIHDKDSSTVWQPDRILWHSKNESFTIDLGKVVDINKLVWINGFGNNTPTEYLIEGSLDNKYWIAIKAVDRLNRVDSKIPQIVEFAPQKVRFVRMKLIKSLNGDSPGISEAWVVPSYLSGVDINGAESFLASPFSKVSSPTEFDYLLKLFEYTGTAHVLINAKTEKINIVYDGVFRIYHIIIPAGGIEFGKIEFSDFTIPGSIEVKSLGVYYPKIKE